MLEIAELILESFDISINNEERRKKIEIINNYQEHQFILDDLKVFLNSNSKQEVKIFGFKCLENFFLYKWNTTDKDIAKSYLIEIIKEYGNFMLDVNAERAVRWIIAKTVMYFIRHECPQNCNSIIEDLIILKDNGIMTKALILSIFYCLSEFIPSDCQMPDKRKKDVISYVTDQTVNMISFCMEVIQENFRNAHFGVINLTFEATKTIQSLSSWIRFDVFTTISNELLPILINSLMVESSDYYLLDVIVTLLERKVKVEEKYSILLIILNNEILWQTFVANISTGLNLQIIPYSDEKFRYLQKLFDLLLIIGNLVVNNWTLYPKDSKANVLNDLIDLILIATHHPVKILSVEFLSFWCNGFKNEQDTLRNILVSKAQSLLLLLKSLSVKRSIRDSTNVDHEYLINLIEESDSEAYYAKVRMEVSKTTSVLTQYFTQDIVALSLEWALSVVRNVQEMEENDIDQLKMLSSESGLIKELDACCFFTRTVMHIVFKPNSKTLREAVQNILTLCSEDIITKANMVISIILATKDVNIYVPGIYIDFLALLLPFAVGQEGKIEQCLEKIFLWFGKCDLFKISSPEFSILRELQMDCGVWLLRIFRDYSFMIPTCLFEKIISYHKSTCNPLYSRPNIMEALSLYICHSGYYSIQQKQSLLALFLDSIKEVICSETVYRIFESGDSLVQYLHMERRKPTEDQGPNYPSLEHVTFRNNIGHAAVALLGLCRRLVSDQNEVESLSHHTKPTEAASITSCPMTDAIMPMLPSLFVILRSINQIWSSRNIHPDFKSVTEISENFRDSLVKTQSNSDKLIFHNERLFGDSYVYNCRTFLSKIHEAVWGVLSKCCINFGHELYSQREWSLGVIEYVFADLGSLPNFKLMCLIKSFLIPYVTFCPLTLVKEVLVPTVIPFINYIFQILSDQWKLIEKNECFNNGDNGYEMDDDDSDHTDLTKEIIEEQVLRVLSKTFINLFRLTMTIGAPPAEDANKSIVPLGVLSDFLCSPGNNGEYPAIMILLNHICVSITWKDSFCCSKLCNLIQPFLKEIHKHGLLTIDIIVFIMQQVIKAMTIFSGNTECAIRLTISNLIIYLYEEHLLANSEYMEKFLQLFDKSSSNAIHTFQHKMLPSSSMKIRREALQNLLQPYIGVPVNEMFSQEVNIRNLPPLLKPEWKSKKQRRLSLEGDDPLCLASLFD